MRDDIFKIGDEVRLTGEPKATAIKAGRCTQGFITSVNAQWFRIADERDGYTKTHLEFVEDEYDAAIKILGEDYFA